MNWKFWQRPKIEQRAAGMGFTAEIMAARESWIAGRTGLGELTATVQSCVSLWENAFAIASEKKKRLNVVAFRANTPASPSGRPSHIPNATSTTG